MAKYKVDILTPDKILATDIEADELFIPTCEGEINILKNHTHIINRLETGVLTIINDSIKSYYSITHGLCKILGEKVVVLSNVAEKQDQINLERAEESLKKSEMKLSGKENIKSRDFIKYSRKIQRAKMRIDIAKNFNN